MLDVVLILCVYWLDACWHDVSWDAKSVLAAVLAMISFLLFAEVRGLYRSWRTSPLVDEIREVLVIWMMVVVTLLMLAFVTKSTGANRCASGMACQ